MGEHRVRRSFNESRGRKRRAMGWFWVWFGVATAFVALAMVLVWDGPAAVAASVALFVAAVVKASVGYRYLRA